MHITHTTHYIPQNNHTAKDTASHSVASSFAQDLEHNFQALSQSMLNTFNTQGVHNWYDTASINGKHIDYMLGGFTYSVEDKHDTLKMHAYVANFMDKGNATDDYKSKVAENSAKLKVIGQLIADDGRRYRPLGISMMSSVYKQEPPSFPEEFNLQSDKGYSYKDVLSNLAKIESLLDKYLVAEYEKNPNSSTTQQLLFLKSKIETLPETLNQTKQWTLEEIAENIDTTMAIPMLDSEHITFMMSNIDISIESHKRAWQHESALLTDFALNLKELLNKEEQQELVDSLNVILNFADHRSHEMLGNDTIELQARLKELLEIDRQRFASKFAAIDNTSILLGLSADSHPSSIHNETKQSIESLFTQIKKARHSDSILREAMALKENHS